jgi:acetyltransferase-like isoleucine patch superfamily enzyme
MKLRTIAYSVYMIFSILISITIATIPAVALFLFSFQNIDGFVNGTFGPLSGLPTLVQTNMGSVMPAVFYERFWFIILLAPLALFCYAIFLGFLLVMFKLSARLIPTYADGYYPKETESWLVYEFKQTYYVLFPHFTWFFSVFMDTKPRHVVFGARIGRKTIVGNGRLFNPERTIIGDNCFFGYDAILSGHVYEGDTLYLKTVRLGNNVTVGANAVVLPGADVGDNVIIAANSTVPKDRVIPSNTIWVHGKAIPRKPLAAQVPLTPVMHAGEEADTPGNGERI